MATAPAAGRSDDARRSPAARIGATRGRLIALAMVGFYFAVLAGLGGHGRWEVLGVEPLSPPFADLRSVTSGWECTRQGVAVLPENPCDPLGHRPANYPRIWMWPAFLGLGQESTVALGVLLAVVFFVAAVAVLPGSAKPLDAVAYGVALCSPAVMLGVERGNVDLGLFALVVAGVLLLRGGVARRWAGAALVLLAAVLKLFPVFGAAAVARLPPRRTLALGGAVLGSFAAYAAAIRGDIRLIARSVPQPDQLSYGIRRFTDWLTEVVAPGWPWLSGTIEQRLSPIGLDLAVAGLLAGAAVVLRLAVPRLLPVSTGRAATRDLDLLYAGAGVYACSYVAFRNWDYRLVFVLLTVPQLLRWARSRNPVGIAGLLAVLGVLWLDAEPYFDGKFTPAVGAQLALFACYAVALAGTAGRGRDDGGARAA